MKIALAQINPTIGDFHGNKVKIIERIKEAKARQCGLIVFSEMVLSGYPPRDLLEQKAFVSENLQCLKELVTSVSGIGVICGFVDENKNNQGHALFNAAALFEDGKILHVAHKRLLPDYDVFDESRYFEPGTASTSFIYQDNNIGITICEDIWNDKDLFTHRLYDIDPVAEMIQDGANCIINISSSPFHCGKRVFKQHMLSRIAKKYSVPLLYVNQVGGNDSVLFDGMSMAFDSNGKMTARARDFQEDLVVVDMQHGRGDLHPITETDTASVLEALVMGTGDYVKKCGFSRAVVGLSGGIDSAVTAAIAVKALGKKNVTGIFMPSKFTSRDNYEDTQELAHRLGMAYTQIPIDHLYQLFLTELAPLFEGIATEVTGQNIQARIRGTLLMAFSNKKGALLLATGNKSELAVGYCTLYGDMCGGLSVISDVPKTMVYELAEWMNTQKDIIPRRIIEKPPTAELRPGQTDQDDLPPYETLDGILQAYVEKNMSTAEIVAAGFDATLVDETITRIVRNEYKRQQAPPGLKVTTKSFGYGRRYPMAQKHFSSNGKSASRYLTKL